MIDLDENSSTAPEQPAPAPERPRAARPAPKRPHGMLYPAPDAGAAPGRVPPHSVEAEEQLLSACLLDGETVLEKCDIAGITAELGICAPFYVPANRVIYARLVQMKQEGKVIDLAVLAEELKTTRQLDEIGGYAYLTRISGRIPTTAGAGYFIEKVKELWMLRLHIHSLTQGVEDAYGYSGGLIELLQRSEAKAKDIASRAQGETRFTDNTAAAFFEYPKRDPNKVLLGHEGALKRGGSIEWVAPTGQGKTSSVTDACMEWALGRSFMGLQAGAPRKILIIQAEDDEEAMGKIISSFCALHKLTEEDLAQLSQNLIISQVKGVIGRDFIAVLEQKCKLHRPDVVVINPVNRYVHGSMSDDTVALEFTAWIDGVNLRLGDSMGYICVSHTGKPPKGEERKAEKSHWEMAYASIGSSAWANYYRTTVYLEPRKTPGRYYLVLGKNYKSWGLRREYVVAGATVVEYVQRIPIKHSDRLLDVDGHARPMIVWEPDEEGGEEGDSAAQGGGGSSGGGTGGRRSSWGDAELVSYYPSSMEAGKRIGELARGAREACGIPDNTFIKRRRDLIEKGWVSETGGFHSRTRIGDDYARLKHQPGIQ